MTSVDNVKLKFDIAATKLNYKQKPVPKDEVTDAIADPDAQTNPHPHLSLRLPGLGLELELDLELEVELELELEQNRRM